MADNFTVPSIRGDDIQQDAGFPAVPSVEPAREQPPLQEQPERREAAPEPVSEKLDPKIQSLIDSLNVPGAEDAAQGQVGGKPTRIATPRLRVPAKTAAPQTVLRPETYPTVDVSRAGAGTVAYEAAKHFFPSLGRSALGVYETFRHPQDTATGLWQLGVGIDSKLRGLAGEKTNPEDERMLDAFMASYKNKYGSIGGLKNAIANDPAGVLLDLSAVFSGGAGAVRGVTGAVGRLPMLGGVGRAGRAAADVLGATSEAINPFAPITRAVGAVAPTTAKVMTAGGYNPKIDAALQGVSKDGTGLQDFIVASQKYPQAKAALDSFKKGFTPQVSKEAFIVGSGGKPLRSVTTGYRPQEELRELSGEVMGRNAESRASLANQLSGGRPSGMNVASDFDKMFAQQTKANSDAWSNLRKTSGVIDKDIFDATFEKSIDDELAKAGGDIKSVSDLTSALEDTPNAQSVFEKIKKELQSNQPMDANRVIRMRRLIQDSLYGSKGISAGLSDVDREALFGILEGFDANVEKAISGGAWSGPADFAKKYADARAGHRNIRQTFFGGATGTKSIPNVAKRLDTIRKGNNLNVGDIINSDVHYGNLNTDMLRELMNPSSGPALYSELVDLYDPARTGTSAEVTRLNDEFRQHLLQLNNEGNFVRSPDEIISYLNDPRGIAQQALSPEDLAMAKILVNGQKVSNTRLASPTVKQSIVGAVGKLASPTAAAFIGSHITGTPMGTAAVVGAEEAGRAALRGLARRSELSGAPSNIGIVPRAMNIVSRFATSPLVVAAAQPLSEEVSSFQMPSQRPQTAGASSAFSKMLPVESATGQFDKSGNTVVSPSGAIGVAQVLPSTGPEAAALAGEKWSLDRLKKDADYNMRLGQAYFNHLLGQFGNDERLAAAAYNAGAARVQKALEKAKALGVSWESLLPDETKDYLRKVFGSATGGRIERASGGRIMNHAAEADRLIAAADRAKKMHNKSTEQLLQLPDEHVTQALAIANESI